MVQKKVHAKGGINMYNRTELEMYKKTGVGLHIAW